MSTDDIASEQAYVSALYDRLDGIRRRTTSRLRTVLRHSESLPRARFERDAASAECAATLARITAAENGLCFGRLDLDGGERRYVGRMGIFDEDADYEPLLIDWRTPAARPFYVATGAARLGVRRRRHITTRRREVTGLDDDVFELAVREPSATELVGEPALFATLNAARTGRMSDIVETIQAEQDRIIRSDHRGILVVQGGPGTGKTAVALHRAAYLLYTHRDRLARSGVLVVGPHPTFLRYIENVLPSLGETSVVSATVEALYPGARADRPEEPALAELKGRAVLADVLAAAVRDRQRLPRGQTLEIHTEERLLLLERSTCARARALARESGELHNQARTIFVRAVIEALARQVADGYAAETITVQVLEADPEALDLLAPAGFGGTSLLDDEDLAQLRRELRADPAVRAALDELWPVLSPEQLVAELYADPGTLASAAPELTAAERRLLHRPLAEDGTDPDDAWLRDLRDATAGAAASTGPGADGTTGADPGADGGPAAGTGTGTGTESVSGDVSGDGGEPGPGEGPRPAGGWTAADIPLLDEAAELLGEDDRAARAAALRDRLARVAYAQGVLDIISRDVEDDPEIMMATDLIDASRLADRHEDADLRTIAERALADRTWTFGHVVVDEAQELSQMAWRMVMRRCPTRSMTIVGDIAQTGDPAGTTSWERVLAPYTASGPRPRQESLTVNYRTPAEIMAVAADVLATLRPPQQPPRSVRALGLEPWRLRVSEGELGPVLARTVLAELDRLTAGQLAVLVPAGRLAELTAAVRAAVPDAETGGGARLSAPVVVLGIREAKGLEFDTVLVVDPDRILA
ncbi:PhoH family protein, partial [Frankia sp. CpI1-P]